MSAVENSQGSRDPEEGILAPIEEEDIAEQQADSRFADAVPLKEFRSKTIGIAGLGATGKQVATILSTMGHKGLWGADPDEIEYKNLGTQGWKEKDIGSYKADILMDTLSNRRSTFIGYFHKFEDCFFNYARDGSYISRAKWDTQVFLCCVDTMRARTTIWNTLKTHNLLQGPKLWIDSRLTSRVIRILTIDLSNEQQRDYYEKTLYTDTEAFQGACTDRMTYYGAGIAAGLVVSQLVNWLNYKQVAIPDFVLETVGMSVTRIN
jgi:hypothetical protein